MASLRPNAFGLSLGLSLAILSLLYWLAVKLFPQAPLAHAWQGMFNTLPSGTVFSGFAAILLGLILGFIMAHIYNRLARSGAWT